MNHEAALGCSEHSLAKETVLVEVRIDRHVSLTKIQIVILIVPTLHIIRMEDIRGARRH